jgi:hypothetical protein
MVCKQIQLQSIITCKPFDGKCGGVSSPKRLLFYATAIVNWHSLTKKTEREGEKSSRSPPRRSFGRFCFSQRLGGRKSWGPQPVTASVDSRMPYTSKSGKTVPDFSVSETRYIHGELKTCKVCPCLVACEGCCKGGTTKLKSSKFKCCDLESCTKPCETKCKAACEPLELKCQVALVFQLHKYIEDTTKKGWVHENDT